MRQPLRYPWPNLDPDDVSAPAIAVRVDVIENKAEIPDHRHRKGQLVFVLGGAVDLPHSKRLMDGAASLRRMGAGRH